MDWFLHDNGLRHEGLSELLINFYFPSNHQKTEGFFMISGRIEVS